MSFAHSQVDDLGLVWEAIGKWRVVIVVVVLVGGAVLTKFL